MYTWKTIISIEQSRREVVNVACEEEGNVSVSTPSTINTCESSASKRARNISPQKIIFSSVEGEDLPSSEPPYVPNGSV